MKWERRATDCRAFVFSPPFGVRRSRFLSISLGLTLLLRRLLVARERVRDQLLDLVLDLVELDRGGLLELLDGLGARLLDLLREPVLLGEVEAADAEDDDDDDDDEQEVAEVVDVADQVVNGAVEDEARAREGEHPDEAARERQH